MNHGNEMEWYWMISANFFLCMNNMMIGYVLCRFARPFLRNPKKAFWIAAAYAGVMTALWILPVETDNFTAYSLGMLSAFFVMCRADRRNYCQKLFIVVTFFALRWLSLYLMNNLTVGLNDWVVYSTYLWQRPCLQLAMFHGVSLLELVLSFLILFTSVTFMEKAYVYKNENMNMKELCMLVTPSVTGMAGYEMMQYYNTHYEESAIEALDGKYRGLAMLYYIISILTIVAMTVMFQNLKARQEEELQNQLLAGQIDSVRQHIGQVEALYQDIRSLQHDMTNHILTLERLYGAHATEEAKAYAVDLKTALAGVYGEMKSGNPVTDVILQEKKNEAAACGIRFTSDFHFPAGDSMNAFDISVILNNALQNALEHAGSAGEPYLSVASYCRKNAYIIEVRNSFLGELRWDTQTGLPQSDKSGSGKAHGYGLSNIRRVAQKYYGDIDIVQKDGEFQLSILLMME